MIVEVDTKDHIRREEYKRQTFASITAYVARFIVGGEKTELIEGTNAPGRIVIFGFPDAGKAKEWWNPPE